MECLQTNNYEEVIRDCFKTDEELLSTWHIEAPADLNTCVNRTMEDLTEASRFKFYSISDGGNTVGFFGSELFGKLPFLTGFFIKPEYRTRVVKDFFWKSVKNKIGRSFMSAIHAKNTRADRFLSKQAHSRTETNEHIIFNIKLQCQ